MSEDQRAARLPPLTYIVAGHPRSGTSMMMRALAQGGLDPAYTPSVDTREPKPNGYIQNPNGFFELSFEAQLHPWFPAPYWGKLIKVGYVQLVGLAPGNYRVVFMMRDPREIRMSYRALGQTPAFPGSLHWKTDADYEPLMRRFMAAAAMRADMHLHEVWYSELMTGARSVFERVRTFGFPIDPARAAAVIDPALYRNRAGHVSEPAEGPGGKGSAP